MSSKTEIPTPEPADESGPISLGRQRRLLRVRGIAASNVAIMVVGCLFLVQYWRLGAMAVFWSLVAALVVAGLNMLFLFRTQRFKTSGYISTFVLFVFLVGGIAGSGGFYDPAFAWLYVVPLAAAFLVDMTALVVFLVLVVIVTVGFWLLPAGSLPDLVPAHMDPFHSLLNRLATILSLGVMTAFFLRAQRLALRLLEKSNLAQKEEAKAHRGTSEALANSEARLRDLVENSADMIWTHDLSGTVLSANESFKRFLGVSAGEVIGSSGEDYVQPDSRAEWDDYLKTIAEEGTYRGMMPFVDASGETKVLEFHNTLRDDAIERPLVRALARDVSRQVASQEALRSRVDQEQLMVSISTRFIETESDEMVSAISTALGELGVSLNCDRLSFFLRPREGREFELLSSWSRDQGPSDGGGSQGAVSVPWLYSRLEQFETVTASRLSELSEAARSDVVALLGTEVRSATIVPVFGKDGLMGLMSLESVTDEREWLREHQAVAHIAGMVFGNAITRDRNERQTLKLEKEVQQARKMESLGLIAGGIAHDFNNLLMIVLGNASLAMSQLQEGSGALEALHAIDSSARRATVLTAQMLAYAGGAVLDRKPTGLSELVELELEQMQADARPGIQLQTSLTGELLEIFGDEALLRQLLRALLENSFEAIGDGGGTVHVKTETVKLDASSPERGYRPIRGSIEPGSYGVLEVRDSGPGIDAGAIQKMFDPFFSTKFAGRGLGLAAVLGVVRGHEGFIEVESGPEGTCVRVVIPLAKGDTQVSSTPPVAGVGSSEGGGDPMPRVLIVDSDPAVLAVLDGLLASRGFETVKAEDAQAAIAELSDGARFVAVVADLKAVEDSDSLLAARWRTEDVPWIISSVEREEDLAERLRHAGASASLSKPFEGRRLLSLLEGLLRQYDSTGSAEARSR